MDSDRRLVEQHQAQRELDAAVQRYGEAQAKHWLATAQPARYFLGVRARWCGWRVVRAGRRWERTL